MLGGKKRVVEEVGAVVRERETARLGGLAEAEGRRRRRRRRW